MFNCIVIITEINIVGTSFAESIFLPYNDIFADHPILNIIWVASNRIPSVLCSNWISLSKQDPIIKVSSIANVDL